MRVSRLHFPPHSIQMLVMLGWRPLSGWITDAFAPQQHWVLLAASLLELATLVVMLLVPVFVTGFNAWIVLGLQVCAAEFRLPGP